MCACVRALRARWFRHPFKKLASSHCFRPTPASVKRAGPSVVHALAPSHPSVVHALAPSHPSHPSHPSVVHALAPSHPSHPSLMFCHPPCVCCLRRCVPDHRPRCHKDVRQAQTPTQLSDTRIPFPRRRPPARQTMLCTAMASHTSWTMGWIQTIRCR